MSGDELFTAIIKRMAWTARHRISLVDAARVFVAISSLNSMSDEVAQEMLNPMVLFETATRINSIVKSHGLEDFVVGPPAKETEKENHEEGNEGDGKGAD